MSVGVCVEVESVCVCVCIQASIRKCIPNNGPAYLLTPAHLNYIAIFINPCTPQLYSHIY